MFTKLSSYTKAGIFYGLAVGLAIIVATQAARLGADGAGIMNMVTALVAVLLMLLVVTRDGYRKAGGQALGCTELASAVGDWPCWGRSSCWASPMASSRRPALVALSGTQKAT